MIHTVKFKNNYFKIHEFGANVISCNIKKTELLFLSKKAKLDGSIPIRGGIPIIFPIFGKSRNNLPKHGFARNVKWVKVRNWENENNSGIIMVLDNMNKKYWINECKLIYKVTLNEVSLTCNLEVKNLKENITFDILFHNYFNVTDISNYNCNDFNNKKYYNQLTDKNEVSKKIVINKEIDRIFSKLDKINFYNGDNQFELISNNTNVVLWNPWIEKSKRLSDFQNEEYNKMICIEPGIFKVTNHLVFCQKIFKK